MLCPAGWAEHYLPGMTPEEERERFLLTDGDDRDRLLREAGGV